MANLVQDGVNGADTAQAEVKPALLFLAGAPGAGKTTFYETKLQAAFPTVLKASASPLEDHVNLFHTQRGWSRAPRTDRRATRDRAHGPY